MQHDLLGDLFKKYYNDALLYVITMSKSKAVAEDIVSAAFFKALETADDSVRNFKWWLFKVCRNLFLDYFRKESRRRPLPDDASDESEQVIEKIIKDEQYAALHKAMSTLKSAYRECILLFYFEEMDVAGISLVTGASVASVKTMLFRARQQLKTILEDEK